MYNINNNDNGGIQVILVRKRKRKRSHNESLPTSNTTTTTTTTSSSSSSSSSASDVSFRTRKQVGWNTSSRILLHISITFTTTMLCTTTLPTTAAMKYKYMNHNNILDTTRRQMVGMLSPQKRSDVVLQPPPPPLRCIFPQWFHLQRGGGHRLEKDDVDHADDRNDDGDGEDGEDDDDSNEDDELLPVSNDNESSLNDDLPSTERLSKKEGKSTTTTATDEVKVGEIHDVSDISIRLSDITPQKDTAVLRESSSSSSSSNPLNQLSQQSQSQSLQQPNSIYRFLLRQGRYGAVIVMYFVFLTEWLTMYVPPIMKLLLWIMSHIMPFTNEYYTNDDDDDHNSIYRRKKISRKERKLQTKYDDAVALQQLQRLENKKAVIYRYVSDDFLQRHAIGPYSKTKLETLQDVTKLIRKTITPTKKSIEDYTEMDIAEEEEEEEDIDWVVEALTAKQPNNNPNDWSQQRRPIPVIQPSISIGIGSSQSTSIEMGLSIDFGTSKTMKQIDRRNVIAQAITAETKIRRPSSNYGNTDSILDKFRAVTGNDSVLLSRTLLGAYPGDAVPISEAANPNGVIELAQKYGYGDWSDDDNDDDDYDNDDMQAVSPTKKMTKTKKKLKPLVHVSKPSKIENDLWKKQDTKHSSPKSKSFSLSFSLNKNSDHREHQQQPPHLKPRRNNVAIDKLRNDISVIRHADVEPSPSSSSSSILQRHRNNNNKFPTKSTKVYAATKLLSNKRKELYSHMEE